MNVHGVRQLLTFNTGDFVRFPELSCYTLRQYEDSRAIGGRGYSWRRVLTWDGA